MYIRLGKSIICMYIILVYPVFRFSTDQKLLICALFFENIFLLDDGSDSTENRLK